MVGTDVSHSVLKRQTYGAENLVCCDGADALNHRFDLIVCNLPYLDTDRVLDASTDGGPGGLKVPMKILRSAAPRVKRGGKFLFVTSSLSDYTGLIEYAVSLGFTARIAARRKIFFEELILIEARK